MLFFVLKIRIQFCFNLRIYRFNLLFSLLEWLVTSGICLYCCKTAGCFVQALVKIVARRASSFGVALDMHAAVFAADNI